MVLKKKAKKVVCKLTPKQNRVWEDEFGDALGDGLSDLQADKRATKEVFKRFPRLRKCTRFE